MSWLDALKQQVLDTMKAAPGADTEGANTEAHHGMFDGVVAMVRGQGLDTMMKSFDANGLKEIFASWVAKGENLPISAEQLSSAFGPGAIEALAKKVGISPGQASSMLSQILPGLIDKMTPHGLIADEPPQA